MSETSEFIRAYSTERFKETDPRVRALNRVGGDRSKLTGESMTPEQWALTKAAFNNRCAICGGERGRIDFDLGHALKTWARDGDRCYRFGNIIPLCAGCNRVQGGDNIVDSYRRGRVTLENLIYIVYTLGRLDSVSGAERATADDLIGVAFDHRKASQRGVAKARDIKSAQSLERYKKAIAQCIDDGVKPTQANVARAAGVVKSAMCEWIKAHRDEWNDLTARGKYSEHSEHSEQVEQYEQYELDV